VALAEWQRPDEDAIDPCALEGARALAKKINAFWSDRGRQANARALYKGYNSRLRIGYYVIESDCKNGVAPASEQS